MPTICVDWDDTLVGYKKYGTPGEWLPGAVEFLRHLKRKRKTIVIHSCRAGWPEGRAAIEAKLASSGFKLSGRLRIEAKPLAEMYIDDRALQFHGEWSEMRKVV